MVKHRSFLLVAALLAVLSDDPALGQSIVTLAGGGTDDGKQATDAALGEVYGLAVAMDPTGNIIVAEKANGHIRRVDARTGLISTVAGWDPWRGRPTAWRATNCCKALKALERRSRFASRSSSNPS